MRFALLLLCLVPSLAVAQSAKTPPERPFTLLLITAAGTNSADPRDAVLRQWINQPQTDAMARWRAWATPKELAATSPIVQEHHRDILRDAESLPALALVDSTNGSRWHLLSGRNLPANEYELARQLDVYFAATMDAARNAAANPHAVQTVDRRQYDSRYRAIGNGPPPFQADPGGIFGPNVNLPTDFGFDADVNTTVDSDTRSWGMKIAMLVAGCVVLFCIALFAAAWIIAEAITDDDSTPPPQ